MMRTIQGLAVLTLFPAAALAQRATVLTPARTLAGHTRLVRCLTYASGGVLISGGQDRLICAWSPRGRLLHQIDLRPSGG